MKVRHSICREPAPSAPRPLESDAIGDHVGPQRNDGGLAHATTPGLPGVEDSPMGIVNVSPSFETPLKLALIRLPSVTAATGLSRSEIYRRVSAGTFPAPTKLGPRASAWPEHEVMAWCQARIAERNAKAAA